MIPRDSRDTEDSPSDSRRFCRPESAVPHLDPVGIALTAFSRGIRISYWFYDSSKLSQSIIKLLMKK